MNTVSKIFFVFGIFIFANGLQIGYTLSIIPDDSYEYPQPASSQQYISTESCSKYLHHTNTSLYGKCHRNIFNTYSTTKESACKKKDGIYKSEMLVFNRYFGNKGISNLEAYNHRGYKKNNHMLYYLIHEHQGETDGDSASHLFQYNCKTKKANELFAETQGILTRGFIGPIDHNNIYFVKGGKIKGWRNAYSIKIVNTITKGTSNNYLFNDKGGILQGEGSKSAFRGSDTIVKAIQNTIQKYGIQKYVKEHNFYYDIGGEVRPDGQGIIPKNINYIDFIQQIELHDIKNSKGKIKVYIPGYKIEVNIDFSTMTIK